MSLETWKAEHYLTPATSPEAKADAPCCKQYDAWREEGNPLPMIKLLRDVKEVIK